MGIRMGFQKGSWQENQQGSQKANGLETLWFDATTIVTWILVCFEAGELVGLRDNGKLGSCSCSLHLRGMHRLLFSKTLPDALTNWAVAWGNCESIDVVLDATTAACQTKLGDWKVTSMGSVNLGSQALCGIKEACDCQSIVMWPTWPTAKSTDWTLTW